MRARSLGIDAASRASWGLLVEDGVAALAQAVREDLLEGLARLHGLVAPAAEASGRGADGGAHARVVRSGADGGARRGAEEAADQRALAGLLERTPGGLLRDLAALRLVDAEARRIGVGVGIDGGSPGVLADAAREDERREKRRPRLRHEFLLARLVAPSHRHRAGCRGAGA